jgi:hypothetical protein
MAATTAEPTTPAAEEHPPPSLVEQIRTIVPKYAHIVAPWQASDRPRAGKDSFNATWTTAAGSWAIRYSGRADASVTLANALTGRRNPAEPVVTVTGPGGVWSFPPNGAVSLLADYLVLVGAVEPVAPPAPKGFAFIGTASDDGLSTLVGGEGISFTTNGQVSRATAETLYGGPLPEAPARDKAREELELTKRELSLLADDARRNVTELEHRHMAVGVDLEEAHRHVRTRSRAVGLLERFYDASLVANIVNGADGQRLVPYTDAANLAADLVEKAIADLRGARGLVNR